MSLDPRPAKCRPCGKGSRYVFVPFHLLLGAKTLALAASLGSVNWIECYVLLFPNEEWNNSSLKGQQPFDHDPVVSQLRPNISYAQMLQDNLQTLSTHNADASGTIEGFLYVPDLPVGHPCIQISKQFIPINATRQANLPPTDFTLVALAPWISIECTQAYLTAARQDPARAFIFYQLDNATSQPPPVSSPAWGMNDGGAWKSQNPYPVYAVPGAIGAHMMHELGLYSGNITSVPFGHQIGELPGIDPRDYVRIYAHLDVSSSAGLPSLWAFLLIIAAVLAVFLGITSAVMHLLQRSRRESLRRRVAIGEVNLEALGIKRLTVPQEFIEKLPLFTYNSEHDKSGHTSTSTTGNPFLVDNSGFKGDTSTTVEEAVHDTAPSFHSQQTSTPSANLNNARGPNPASTPNHKFLPYSQPTCAICLDDFESGITPIRELPCGHIFHPECIDMFLSNNSSLCPLCKKSVLPQGYCPATITNAMVRRERNLRNLRSRVTINDESGDVEPEMGRWRTLATSVKRIIFRSHQAQARNEQVLYTMSSPRHPAVMTSALPAGSLIVPSNSEDPIHTDSSLTRQQIAEARIRELNADQLSIQDPDTVAQRHRSKCEWSSRRPSASTNAFQGDEH